MKIKTNELQGAALDWSVARCEGVEHLFSGHEVGRLHYSTDWSQGGPIIEREEIFLAKSILGGWTGSIMTHDNRVRCIMHGGPTPLIAAMRCFVASKLGDEIDLPADLALECLIYEAGDE